MKYCSGFGKKDIRIEWRAMTHVSHRSPFVIKIIIMNEAGNGV